MQLISKFSKWICILLCAFDIFSKYAWVIPLKDKKGISITNDFQKLLIESNPKPTKIWIGKGSKFYSRSMNTWLEKNAIKIEKMKKIFCNRKIYYNLKGQNL